MRTILALVLALAVAIGALLLYRRFLAPVEERACARVGDRCGLERDEIDACRRVIAEVRKAGGDDPADRLARCLADSESCVAAAGCATGAGSSLLSRNLLEFLGGLRRGR